MIPCNVDYKVKGLPHFISAKRALKNSLHLSPMISSASQLPWCLWFLSFQFSIAQPVLTTIASTIDHPPLSNHPSHGQATNNSRGGLLPPSFPFILAQLPSTNSHGWVAFRALHQAPARPTPTNHLQQPSVIFGGHP